MTIAKQDPLAWRKRVDQKVNYLSKGHEDLTARLDIYAKSMDDNTSLTKKIDRKIDDLMETTKTAVEFAERARWTAKAVRWFWAFSRQMMVWIGQFGVALVTVFTLYWVFEKGGSWTKAFINIFNGNLN